MNKYELILRESQISLDLEMVRWPDGQIGVAVTHKEHTYFSTLDGTNDHGRRHGEHLPHPVPELHNLVRMLRTWAPLGVIRPKL